MPCCHRWRVETSEAHPAMFNNPSSLQEQNTNTDFLGHSESYSYGLEIETALAEALDEVSTHLTPHIVVG